MINGGRVVVFGGSGFLGRHIVRRLAKAGARIIVAARDAEAAAQLKPVGDPGQVVPRRADLLDEASVAAAAAGADVVVNLVGILFESGRQSFAAVHTQGARRVAEAASAAGAKRLIHVSAVGAAPTSRSLYARTKAAGEAAVRGAFPHATIVRPSIVFGPEDVFFNRFAAMARFTPALPLIGGGHTRFQPVYVGDVAEAVLRIAADPATAGKTYELGGPRVYTFREVLEVVLRATGRRRLLVPLPFWAADLEALFLERLPKPLLTRDQVKLLRRDNVVGANALGLADLGITPTSVEAVVPAYLARYRRAGAAQSAPSP
ncbi:MAG: complex I NDUFA9 subunit family protein [Proteobacteria bacterium]|nr:complex I NDUFA9 subunit family protein [Pseudomonadota bacterium]